MKRIAFGLLLNLYMVTMVLAQKQPAPTLSDVLENSLASVITVGVYKEDYASAHVSTRGAKAISEEAYKKALDLGDRVSSGSGFVVEINGIKYAITNYHVISNASQEPGSIKIFSISRTPYEARVVGGDPFYDVAVLEFIDPPGKELTTVKFKTEEPRIGERVFAIGNPLGALPYSVSDGIISAKNRVRGGLTGKFGYLQSTATVIWGNSGGPIVDEKGKVAGINTYIEFAQSPDGSQVWQSQINYALEARLANRLTKEIVNNKGSVVRAYLGIEFSKKSIWYDDGYENQEIQKVNEPPVITGVIANSPAVTKLRSKYGYAVTAVNGEEVRNMEELLGLLEETKPNQDVVLTIAKDSATVEKVTIRTGELKDEHLEEIAMHLLKKEKSITLQDQVPYVGIEFKPSRFRMVETEVAGAVLSYGTQKEWKVVTAGLNSGAPLTMYKVESLRDVGAAIKLTSMSGALDLNMIGPDDEVSNMRLFRFSFSDEANMIEAILYY